MAMSARTASLLAQRGQYNPYGSTGRIRLLSPSNNSIATIARKSITSELNVMISKYNNGEISNEEMRDFLSGLQSNSNLSDSDQLDISEQVRDFDSRVQLEALTTAYKQAPENSLEEIQAADAIAAYYQAKGDAMQDGTPAQSQAYQSVAEWQARAEGVQDAINKNNARSLRYQKEFEIGGYGTGTSEKEVAKANAYMELANQAAADGDEVSYNKYLSYSEKAATRAQELYEKELQTDEKTQIKEALNSYVDMYHDGQINERQYLQLLAEIAPRIDAFGDYGLINTLNRTTDTIQKNLDKGGLKRTITESGLPAVIGTNKSGSGSGSGIVTDWDQEDWDYTDTLRQANEKLSNGEIDSAQYGQIVGTAMATHYVNIEDQIQALEAQSATNPYDKVKFEGRNTTIESALEKLYKEKADLQGASQAIEQGTAAFVEIPPNEFTSSGDVRSSGKAFATLKLVDTNNMDMNLYAPDNEGVFHKIEATKRYLTPEEQATTFGNTYTDANGQTFYLKGDAETGFYIETGEPYIKAYKPGSSEYVEVAMNKDGLVPGWNASNRMLEQDANRISATGATPEERKRNFELAKKEFLARREASKTGLVDEEGRAISTSEGPQKPALLDLGKVTRGLNIGSTPEQPKDRLPAGSTVSPEVVPQQEFMPVQPRAYEPPAPVSRPSSGSYQSAPSSLKLQLPKQSALTSLSSRVSMPELKIPAPPTNTFPTQSKPQSVSSFDKQAAAQRAQTKDLTSTIKNAWNTVKSWRPW